MCGIRLVLFFRGWTLVPLAGLAAAWDRKVSDGLQFSEVR